MKSLKYILLICLLVLSVPFSAVAQKELSMSLGEPQELFSQGNQFYESGEYDQASKEYEKILQMGKQSGPLYFNLANSYFRIGMYGRAILNYERAERLMPRDADVKANYNFARSMVKNKIIPKKGIWGWPPFVKYYKSFTINELVLISSLLFLSFLTALFVMLTGAVKLRYKFIIIVIMLSLLIINTATLYYKSYSIGKDAVVIVPRADVLYGPFKSATKFFTLHEGSGVTILETKGQWDKVRRSDNKAGWISKKAVEVI